MAPAVSGHGADAVERVAPLEDSSVPGRMGSVSTRERSPREHGRDVVVALVLGAAEARHDLEVASRLGRLDGQGHHEVGLVEVPLQQVARRP